MNAPVLYRVSIPETTVSDPVQAIVDGLTVLHSIGGMPAVERALESVMDIALSYEGSGE